MRDPALQNLWVFLSVVIMAHWNQLSTIFVRKSSDDRMASFPANRVDASLIFTASVVMFLFARCLPEPSGMILEWRYIRVVICLSRGFRIFAVLTLCERPVLASALSTSAFDSTALFLAPKPLIRFDECAHAFRTNCAWRSM